MPYFRYVLLTMLFAGVCTPASASDPSAEELRYVKQATDSASLEPIGGNPAITTGKTGVRVTFFFASWCAFCKKTHPKLEKLLQKYSRAGVQIVGISTEEKIDEARKYANAEKGQIPLYFLKTASRPNKPESLGVYPLITVQDSKGKVVALYTGYQNERFGQLEKTIRWALKEE